MDLEVREDRVMVRGVAAVDGVVDLARLMDLDGSADQQPVDALAGLQALETVVGARAAVGRTTI